MQVGVEKTKVNLENEAAQVEAEKCGVIAKDVTELQARCEKDLAAAEPLVAQAEAALDTLNKKDLGECSKVCPLTHKNSFMSPFWASQLALDSLFNCLMWLQHI